MDIEENVMHSDRGSAHKSLLIKIRAQINTVRDGAGSLVCNMHVYCMTARCFVLYCSFGALQLLGLPPPPGPLSKGPFSAQPHTLQCTASWWWWWWWLDYHTEEGSSERWQLWEANVRISSCCKTPNVLLMTPPTADIWTATDVVNTPIFNHHQASPMLPFPSSSVPVFKSCD